MTFKEILITTILALAIGVLLIHYEDLVDRFRGDDSEPLDTVQTDPSSSPQPSLVSTPSPVEKTAPSRPTTEVTATSSPISASPVSTMPPVEEIPTVTPPKTEENEPIITQLKGLYIFDAPVKVKFWLNALGKTQFSSDEELTLYYQIAQPSFLKKEILPLSFLAKEILPYSSVPKEILPFSPVVKENKEEKGEFYFTLFNISPTGELSILLENKKIEAGKRYSLPESQQQISIKKELRLRLKTGREYFKAIVTAEPITSWLKFLETDVKDKSQRQKLLGAKKLWVKVD
jgi:hypothetical protein